MPANLYGIGDNFDLKSSHVLPALVKKFTIAKIRNLPFVEVWGSGKVKREFLNVEDLSSAIYFIIKKKIKKDFIKIIGYKGKIIFNKKYPDGVKKRKLDSNIIKKLGWKPKIRLEDGLIKYCEYYRRYVMPNE